MGKCNRERWIQVTWSSDVASAQGTAGKISNQSLHHFVASGTHTTLNAPAAAPLVKLAAYDGDSNGKF